MDEKRPTEEDTDPHAFTGLSSEETDDLDYGEKTDEEEFDDAYPDWDDEEDTARGNKKRQFVIGILAVLLAFACTLWWLMSHETPETAGNTDASHTAFKHQIKKKTTGETAGRPETLIQIQQTKQKNQIQNNGPAIASSFSGLERKVAEAARLRSELLKKQKEIHDLQQLYRDRINEMEIEILQEKRNAHADSFEKAIKVKRIEFGLRTIHRRNSYIDNLNIPANQLHLAGEDLLYIQRLAAIEMEMAHVIKGIDLVNLEKQIDLMIQKHADGLNRLAMEPVAVATPDLKAIWEKQFPEKKTAAAKKNMKKAENKSEVQARINAQVLLEIRKGDLSRKHELTSISSETAIHLSKWPGKDLVLKGVSELTPSTAKILASWKGNWLCLNALREISPKTAKYLSQWQGKRLSLNGLATLSKQAARELSDWKGTELEMIGLSKASPATLKYLNKWEDSGGKIYMANKFQKNP